MLTSEYDSEYDLDESFGTRVVTMFKGMNTDFLSDWKESFSGFLDRVTSWMKRKRGKPLMSPFSNSSDDEYDLEDYDYEDEKSSIIDSPLFYIGIGLLAATAIGGGVGYYVSKRRQNNQQSEPSVQTRTAEQTPIQSQEQMPQPLNSNFINSLTSLLALVNSINEGKKEEVQETVSQIATHVATQVAQQVNVQPPSTQIQQTPVIQYTPAGSNPQLIQLVPAAANNGFRGSTMNDIASLPGRTDYLNRINQ